MRQSILPLIIGAAALLFTASPAVARKTDYTRHDDQAAHHQRSNDGRISKRERRFDHVDRNDDGRISKRERRFDHMDRNDDGRISKRERRFDRVDRNDDGRISKRERRHARKSYAYHTHDHRSYRRTRYYRKHGHDHGYSHYQAEMDRNDNGKVSWGERIQYMRNLSWF